jgi:hypothetical protein
LIFSSELVCVRECNILENYKVVFINWIFFYIKGHNNIILNYIWNLKSFGSIHHFYVLKFFVEINIVFRILGFINIIEKFNSVFNISTDKKTVRLWARLKLYIFLIAHEYIIDFDNEFFSNRSSNYWLSKYGTLHLPKSINSKIGNFEISFFQ